MGVLAIALQGSLAAGESTGLCFAKGSPGLVAKKMVHFLPIGLPGSHASLRLFFTPTCAVSLMDELTAQASLAYLELSFVSLCVAVVCGVLQRDCCAGQAASRSPFACVPVELQPPAASLCLVGTATSQKAALLGTLV